MKARQASGVLLAVLVSLVAAGAGAASAPSTRPARPVNFVESRLLLAMPAALPTGMMTGLELSYARSFRSWLAGGARFSWSTATEYASDYVLGWSVRNDDVRFRLLGLLRGEVGRATLGLRLGVGATMVYEALTPQHDPSSEEPPVHRPWDTAQISKPASASSRWRLLPALELEPFIVLGLLGGWGLSLGGGPTLHIVDGAARWGWTAGLGVAWQR